MNTLTPLFDWLLTASLRASVLTIVVLGVQFVLRRQLSARARYALWLPVLIVLLTPVFPESRWSIENVFVTAPEPVQTLSSDFEALLIVAAPVTAVMPIPAAPIDWSRIRPQAWIFIAAALLSFIGFSFVKTLHRFKITRLLVSDDLNEKIAEIAREVGLRHPPRVWASAAIQSPAVTGLLRPVLLLPAQFDRHFTPAESRLILQHELTHLKRHDLPLNALMCLLIALHWFNPLLWLAFFCVRADREAACDAQVLHNATPRRRSDYGHALLKVETAFAPLRLCLGFVGLFQRGAALRSRIQSIATQHQPHPAMKLITTVCIVLMTFLGITSAAIDAEKVPTITIKARFIEITGKANQPTDADEVLAQTLADMPLTDNNGGPLKAVLDDAQNQTFVRRISQQKRVDLMSTPSVTTRSGQKATIEVAREFALPPGQKPLEKKVGVMMDVLPTLSDENWLDLTVNPRVVEFEGFLKDKQGQQQPVFNERKADARLRLKSGQTAVLDLGKKIDAQVVEDITDGKVVRREDFFTRRVIVLVTAQVVDAAPKDAPAAGFTIGQSLFRPGDDIRITQVQRGADFMTVTADYELSSAEEAKISLYITSTKNTSGTKTATEQSKRISKGKGTVVLHHPSIDEGMPHVSFYPASGGKAFGGIYFGTVEEADRSRKMNLSYLTSETSDSATDSARMKLLAASARDYDFKKEKLADVCHRLATDAGIDLRAFPENDPDANKLITFWIGGSPFRVLETICKANALILLCDKDQWYVRRIDDRELFRKSYPIPALKAALREALVTDLLELISGSKSKDSNTADKSRVIYKESESACYVTATRL
jgi:bla regulator protein blaR1